MMSDDLVKRLRDWENVWLEDEDKPEGSLYLAAADRIEELEERLKAATDDAKEAEAYAGELEAVLESIKAKLVKAVEALVRIADTPSEMTWGVDSEVRESMNGMETIAEATLAELTGGKDE